DVIVADVSDTTLSLGDSADLEADLIAFGVRFLRRVLAPQVIELRRLVIGEAARFPEFARLFYEQGPQRTIEHLADCLRRFAMRGDLDIDDPILAAGELSWLLVSAPQNLLLFSVVEGFSDAELERFAASAVHIFLFGCRTPGEQELGRGGDGTSSTGRRRKRAAATAES